jgi:hypothetical protein
MYGIRRINNVYVSDGSGRDILLTKNPEFRGGRTQAEFLKPPAWETNRMRNPEEKPLPVDLHERRKILESYAYGKSVLGIDDENPMELFHRLGSRRGPRPFDRSRAKELASRSYNGTNISKATSTPSLAKYAESNATAYSPERQRVVLPNYQDEILGELARGSWPLSARPTSTGDHNDVDNQRS